MARRKKQTTKAHEPKHAGPLDTIQDTLAEELRPIGVAACDPDVYRRSVDLAYTVYDALVREGYGPSEYSRADIEAMETAQAERERLERVRIHAIDRLENDVLHHLDNAITKLQARGALDTEGVDLDVQAAIQCVREALGVLDVGAP